MRNLELLCYVTYRVFLMNLVIPTEWNNCLTYQTVDGANQRAGLWCKVFIEKVKVPQDHHIVVKSRPPVSAEPN